MLAREPSADLGTRIIAQAYAELATCRSPGGMGTGPISWIAMVTWASYNNMNRHNTAKIIHVVRLVDNEMLRRANTPVSAPTRKGRR